MIQYRYTDWQGKRRKSTKRGFATKREAEEWLRNFLITQKADFDMKFENFWKMYYAGYELYGGPVIVVDFGTATTYDLITQDGRFVGGVTSPGIRTSANALWQQAAKLPEIEIRKPKNILAKDTVTSMQGGLVYGYIGQTEYIIRKMKEESGLGKINVVATGGLGKMIAKETSFINYYDANLTLKGLQIIYDKQKQD